MANFTELFSEYLKTHEVPSVLDKLPPDESGKTFKERFIERNYYKEIGSETEELFEMHLQIRCDECVEDYSWRIKLFNDNLDKLMLRYIETHNEDTRTFSGIDTNSVEDKNYFNPADENNSEMISDKSKSDGTISYGKTERYISDRQHAVSWARSNPEILKASLELEDVYTKALASLDDLFMVIL